MENAYFMNDDGKYQESPIPGLKPVVTFAETDEERMQMQKEIDENKAAIKHENKLYLILMLGYEKNSDVINMQQWDYVVGRQATYDLIKEYLLDKQNASEIAFDLNQSRVLVQSSTGKVDIKGVSVFNFMRIMREENKVVDDSSFDIYEWAVDEERAGEEE